MTNPLLKSSSPKSPPLLSQTATGEVMQVRTATTRETIKRVYDA